MKPKLSVFILLLILISCNNNSERKPSLLDSIPINKTETIYVKEPKIEKVEIKKNQPPGGGGKAIDFPLVDSVVEKKDDDKVTEMDLIGTWKIIMESAFSDCENTSVGDIKSETWNISKKGGKLIVDVTENDNTNTSYEGELYRDKLTFSATYYSGFFKGKIRVDAGLINDHLFQGTREIMIDVPCRIVYSLKAKKRN